MENSYRATILAFLDEWSVFAERNGVDLTKVIKAIKVRPTHSNMIFPGPGIGGYCLPKDGGLGMWAYRHILGWEDSIFKITPEAININDTRALRVAQLARDALRNMDRSIAAADVILLGASYREDVGDTRYCGSEIIVRRLTEMGAEMRVHDPYVAHWWEFESQDTYPSPGHSWARFFRNQEKLKDLRVNQDLDSALKGADVVILAVRHEQYLDLDPDDVVRKVGKPCAIIDCFAMLDDARSPLLRARLRSEGTRTRACQPHQEGSGKGQGEMTVAPGNPTDWVERLGGAGFQRRVPIPPSI